MKRCWLAWCLISSLVIGCAPKPLIRSETQITQVKPFDLGNLHEFAYWHRKLEYSSRKLSAQDISTYVASRFTQSGLKPVAENGSFVVNNKNGGQLAGLRFSNENASDWVVIAGDIADPVARAAFLSLVANSKSARLPLHILFTTAAKGELENQIRVATDRYLASNIPNTNAPQAILVVMATNNDVPNYMVTLKTALDDSLSSRAAFAVIKSFPQTATLQAQQSKNLNITIGYQGIDRQPFAKDLGSRVMPVVWRCLAELVRLTEN